MEQTFPTRGELERSLSQNIQAFYRNQLGCRTEKINCHIINNQVAIAIQNSITPLERLLNKPDDHNLKRDLRDRIDTIVKNELLSRMETILRVQIIDLTINTTLDNNFTGIVALLAETPEVRMTKNSRKFKNVND